MPVCRVDTALLAATRAIMRQAAGVRANARRSEAGPFDPAELVRRIREGRRRASENWEVRKLEAPAGTRMES